MSAPVTTAADTFLSWQEQHIAAPVHNHVVSTVWALASYFAKDVPVFARLGYVSTRPVSGKSTAAQATAEVGNFDDVARYQESTTPASAIRRAHNTGKGVKIEDLHRHRSNGDLHTFLVNSFSRRGVQTKADLKDQLKEVVYTIGGTPVLFTMNKPQLLDMDVRRRSIILPMMRSETAVRVDDEDREAALADVRATFQAAGETSKADVRSALSKSMPTWMDAGQKDRWLALYAVARALLGDEWTSRLDTAAQHLEGVTAALDQTSQLLADIREVKGGWPGTIGILPDFLYTQLREVNPEEWGEWSPTKFGRELRGILDKDGRALTKENVPADGSKVAGFVKRVTRAGAKFYPWSHFTSADLAA